MTGEINIVTTKPHNVQIRFCTMEGRDTAGTIPVVALYAEHRRRTHRWAMTPEVATRVVQGLLQFLETCNR